MNQQAITSFVVRFQSNNGKDSKQPHYRIKVTHVQNEQEMTFENLEDAFHYMKESVDQEVESN
ncbi:hypothetical protein HNQ94_002621 [Salirhabdus euzebyi]|uniref:Uncharacterized protein n=1 Tax=Salirhabdus euzebyi TaxID=394506 RepID=A0A841Q6Y0_9BACI|nr:hypothetical protein [Salirhabdus euzebyi]MBB6454170.1 hypothetical protein [Salirhabdus euzebyi]